MDPAKVDDNINFRRACMLLDKRIDSPEYLITMWKIMGDHYGTTPWPERCSPWYKGLEGFIV